MNKKELGLPAFMLAAGLAVGTTEALDRTMHEEQETREMVQLRHRFVHLFCHDWMTSSGGNYINRTISFRPIVFPSDYGLPDEDIMHDGLPAPANPD